MMISPQELKLIADYQPRIHAEESLLSAATAIILRDGPGGTEFLMMQRAIHADDPWSGQMAFPGGKVEPDDPSKKAAAIRETAEEVGIELTEQDFIGQLDDVYGIKVNNQYSVHVSCFVFKPERELRPKGNYEVADIVWLPLSYLDDVKNTHEFYHPYDKDMRLPAIMINADKNQILWGLSLRMLSTLLNLLDRPVSAIQIDT